MPQSTKPHGQPVAPTATAAGKGKGAAGAGQPVAPTATAAGKYQLGLGLVIIFINFILDARAMKVKLTTKQQARLEKARKKAMMFRFPGGRPRPMYFSLKKGEGVEHQSSPILAPRPCIVHDSDSDDPFGVFEATKIHTDWGAASSLPWRPSAGTSTAAVASAGHHSDSLHSSSSRPSLHCSSGSLGSGPHSDPLRECHAASQDSVVPTELDSDNDDSQMPSPTAAALASSTACQAASGATTSNGEGATTSNGEGATTSAAASSTAVIGSDAEGATTSNPPPSLQPSESQTIAEGTCPVADNDPYLELLEPTHGENWWFLSTQPQAHELPNADLVPVDLGPEVPVDLGPEQPPPSHYDAMLEELDDGWDIALLRSPTPRQVQEWYNKYWHHLPVAQESMMNRRK